MFKDLPETIILWVIVIAFIALFYIAEWIVNGFRINGGK